MERIVPKNFITDKIDESCQKGEYEGRVVTRFPPEPNGFLHIGHAKSIVLNFSLALDYRDVGGTCHLRFDDTNPDKEDEIYLRSIEEDVKWLGYDWGDKLFFASDYFEKFYEYAKQLIRKKLAYVCELSIEQMREYRGTLTSAGRPCAGRDRSCEENLDLFEKMRAGEFEDGSMCLRAKIDLASPNMNLRDPVLYRIKSALHPRTKGRWKIYPTYDFAHGLSDAIEGVTHSLCTMEFDEHRALYDWILEKCEVHSPPRQIEFARLNLDYTVMSKRLIGQLIGDKKVSGWDDPRLPTLRGMKRRGFTPRAIRQFCLSIGVTRKDSSISLSTLEHALREDLEKISPRVLGVLNPLEVELTNYEGREEIRAPFHPQDSSFGDRGIPFSKRILIEREDFQEDPPKKFFRLAPGRSVRLRYAYVITCDEVVKDDEGRVCLLKCRYHKESFGGRPVEGMKKVKGIIHWVSAMDAHQAQVRLYDRLFETPAADGDVSPRSLRVANGQLEPFLKGARPGDRFQLERLGYFIVDGDGGLNRSVTLKDTWARKGAR